MPKQFADGLSTEMVYAIVGSKSEFGPEHGMTQLTPKTLKPKFEGRGVYELLRGAGTRIYPIAADLGEIAGDRTYHSLSAVPGSVDVLIDCLAKDHAVRVVEEAAAAGIRHIFFQPGTDTPEAFSLCEAKGIKASKGCMLRHWPVSGLHRFISPCFYMGLGATKLPAQ